MGRASMSGEGTRKPAGADLLSVREAAATLGVHEHTLRGWVRKGIISAIHLPSSHYCRFKLGEVRRLQLQMEGRKAEAGVRIERPRTGPDDLELAHKLHDEVMAILSEQPPEETLEEVMTRLRGRPWSS
ncbi:MAG: helix-turn-helix domain-containing protein [Dehalococcoidia bacterium]|nr:helix-turn-helix domain-containing protein [Dehalococcoidia bacterium]